MIKFELRKIDYDSEKFGLTFQILEQSTALRDHLPFNLKFNGTTVIHIDSCDSPQLASIDGCLFVRGAISEHDRFLTTEIFKVKEDRDIAYDIIIMAFKQLSRKWKKS